MSDRIEVNAVAFQEGDVWVAQCVEFDIAARAASLSGLKAAFERAVAANLCVNVELGRTGFDGIPAAPAEFQRMFDAADVSVRPVRRGRRGGVKIGDLRLAA